MVESTAASPNVDVEAFFAGVDLSALADIGVHLDAAVQVQIEDPSLGFGGVGGLPTMFLGFLKNAPPAGARSVIRIVGFARCIYGGFVDFRDPVKFSETPGDEAKVVPWIPGTDGHTHIATLDTVERVVLVTDANTNPIAGVDPANVTIDLQWSNAGTLTAASEPVHVTDVGGGKYLIDFAPDHAGVLYWMQISCTLDGVVPGAVTPPDFQLTTSATLGVPRADSLRVMLGQAMRSGGAGDPGLIFLRPQFI